MDATSIGQRVSHEVPKPGGWAGPACTHVAAPGQPALSAWAWWTGSARLSTELQGAHLGQNQLASWPPAMTKLVADEASLGPSGSRVPLGDCSCMLCRAASTRCAARCAGSADAMGLAACVCA